MPLPRLALRRRPVLYWVAAATLALLTASFVATAVSSAHAARERYGATRLVAVAARDLPAGHMLVPGDSEQRQLPAATLPGGTLDHPVDGVTLAIPVSAGEVLLEAKLAPAAASELAALLPPGARGVAIPPGPAPLPVQRGDLVDVLVTLDSGLAGAAPAAPTGAITRGALVLDVTETGVTVAVPEDDAARVVFALTAGVVTLVLSGPG